jgi:hypothetical protein
MNIAEPRQVPLVASTDAVAIMHSLYYPWAKVIRRFSVGPVQPYAQYRESAMLMLYEPRQQRPQIYTITPGTSFWTIELEDGSVLYNSREEIPFDLARFREAAQRDNIAINAAGDDIAGVAGLIATAQREAQAQAKYIADRRDRRKASNIKRVVDELLRDSVVGNHTHCAICGRTLTDPISIRRGIGPECWEVVLGHLERQPSTEWRSVLAARGWL